MGNNEVCRKDRDRLGRAMVVTGQADGIGFSKYLLRLLGSRIWCALTFVHMHFYPYVGIHKNLCSKWDLALKIVSSNLQRKVVPWSRTYLGGLCSFVQTPRRGINTNTSIWICRSGHFCFCCLQSDFFCTILDTFCCCDKISEQINLKPECWLMVSKVLLCRLLTPLLWDRGTSKHHGSRDGESREHEGGGKRIQGQDLLFKACLQ